MKSDSYLSIPAKGKLSSLNSKEEEKKKTKPTAGVGRGKGGDPIARR